MSGPLTKLRQTLIALTQRGARADTVKTIRRGLAMLANTARLPEVARNEQIGRIADLAAFHAHETGRWVQPTTVNLSKIASGHAFNAGFDACDIGIWLAIAEAAQIEAIPARRILELTEDEHSSLTAFSRDDMRSMLGFVAHSAERNSAFAAGVGPTLESMLDVVRDPTQADHDIDAAELVERCAAAMDEVPEGWMVRFSRCGSENLKALSSCGAAGYSVPEVRFGSDLEVGPGWFRRGNRRCVDVTDTRIVKASAEAPVGPHLFYARPWYRPTELVEADDPTRAGSAFAGKGFWPIELRAFVENGVVTGVSNYYPQIALPVTWHNAFLMLEARKKAQALADACTRAALYPRYMDVDFARQMDPAKAPEGFLASLEKFSGQAVSFTCDFLFTDHPDSDGDISHRLVFLEAGPAATPVGGGHPCCFAGCGGPPKHGARMRTQGAAFSLMPHVNIFEPRTWTDGDEAGHILSWAEVEAILVGQKA